MAKTTHIAVLPVPVYSHQASIVEFCKRLVCVHQHFHVTCIIPIIGTPIPEMATLFESLPSNIDYTFLTPINKEDLPQGLPPFVQVLHAMSQSMPSFRNALSSLCSSTPLAALVADVFAKEAFEIAREFNLLSYIYFPSSAMAFSGLLHFPSLTDSVLCEEVIQIPGCMPMQVHDYPSDFKDPSSLIFESYIQCCNRFSLVDGFFVNSFLEMEHDTQRALQEHSRDSYNNAPVYLVGPIVRNEPSSKSNESEIVRWLEKQRPNSVLYVSFGSGGSLSKQQLDELALGLELSGQKFVWALRAPNDSEDASAAYLVDANDEALMFLPDGFLDRTKGQGLVVPCWVPQIQILSHTSTGGFLTHCGWNSALESIVVGMPMITWPLFSEQGMNTVLLTEGLKVALRPKFNENGLVEREEIAKVIRGLMLSEEGNEIRQRSKKLKDAAADALKENGSSTMALLQFGTRMENFLSSQ